MCIGADTIPQPSTLSSILNAADFALQLLVECRALETERVRLVAMTFLLLEAGRPPAAGIYFFYGAVVVRRGGTLGARKYTNMT